MKCFSLDDCLEHARNSRSLILVHWKNLRMRAVKMKVIQSFCFWKGNGTGWLMSVDVCYELEGLRGSRDGNGTGRVRGRAGFGCTLCGGGLSICGCGAVRIWVYAGAGRCRLRYFSSCRCGAMWVDIMNWLLLRIHCGLVLIIPFTFICCSILHSFSSL